MLVKTKSIMAMTCLLSVNLEWLGDLESAVCVLGSEVSVRSE